MQYLFQTLIQHRTSVHRRQEGCWFTVYHLHRIMSLRLSICIKHLTNIRDRPLRLHSQAFFVSYSFKKWGFFPNLFSFFFFLNFILLIVFRQMLECWKACNSQALGDWLNGVRRYRLWGLPRDVGSVRHSVLG